MANEHDPSSSGSGQSTGPSTDRDNTPVVDPTKNVLDLVGMAMRRQDDLRTEREKFTTAQIAHVVELTRLRALERESDVANLQTLAKIRAEHDKELRDSEAARINAIREVDNQAVQQAAQVSATQATTLAGQVAASAEAMRVQVAATASASATALANALEPITKAIEDLRRAQYEAQGQKTQVVETQASDQHLSASVGLMIAAISVLLSGVAIVVTVLLVK